MDYIKDLPIWPFTIIAALLTILGAIQIQRTNSSRAAASTFCNEVFNALKGIYPSLSIYVAPDEINKRILQSIPQIITAATAFGYHLPFYRKSTFNKTTQNYIEIARNTDWNSHIAWLMFPDMP